FATRVEPIDPTAFRGGAQGSDINPIPSGLGHGPDRGGPGTGPIPSPDLGPTSSIDLPSGGPSAGTGSDLPRFDPNASSGIVAEAPKGFDPNATSGSGVLGATELGPDAIAMQADRHDPMATSAVGL